MKILHTSAFYHPRSGGAEEVVRQLSERLAARGHDVTVATTSLADRQAHVHNGVRIAQFDIHGVCGHSALGIRGEKSAFQDLLHIGDWDVIMNYAAQTWPTDLTCRVLSRLKAKTVLAACGYSGLIGVRPLLYEGYFRRLPHYLRQYSAVVYHSGVYRDKAFGDAHGIRHFQVIPNGVDSLEFESSAVDFRSAYGIETRRLLVTIGNHYSNKGHDRVIDAFEQLADPDATLVIVGKPSAPWFRSCHRTCMSSANRNPRILLLDHAPRSHVVAALLAADLFLFGSHIEAFPLVILEAMASRTPWIAFPAGNMEELHGGLVVHSSVEMASAARRLLDDPDAHGQLAEAGYRTQRRDYDWESIVDRYEDLYESLVAGEFAPDAQSANLVEARP
ncbi:MAG: glycosyltransferase family 4 protein [Bryobacteraceae bacterium]